MTKGTRIAEPINDYQEGRIEGYERTKDQCERQDGHRVTLRRYPIPPDRQGHQGELSTQCERCACWLTVTNDLVDESPAGYTFVKPMPKKSVA